VPRLLEDFGGANNKTPRSTKKEEGDKMCPMKCVEHCLIFHIFISPDHNDVVLDVMNQMVEHQCPLDEVFDGANAKQWQRGSFLCDDSHVETEVDLLPVLLPQELQHGLSILDNIQDCVQTLRVTVKGVHVAQKQHA